jgi:hypothetical protein
MVVEHEVFALGDDSYYLLEVDQLAFFLVFHVEVDCIDGDLHLAFFLTTHAVVA